MAAVQVCAAEAEVARAVADGTMDVDLAAAKSLTEEEVEKFWAPEELVAVEEKLHQERQQKNAAPPAAAPVEKLDNGVFPDLQDMLNKSEMYTQFLLEQMEAFDFEADAKKTEEAEGAPAEAAKPKRGRPAKGGKGKAQAAPVGGKRTREEMEQAKAGSKDYDQLNAKVLLPLLKADLRDYQLKGIKWLISLYSTGISGILADQMGLGKTVQTIGLLAYLKSKQVHGPFLVVGPLSTLTNWVNEINRFCPSLPVLLYHGTPKEREVMRCTRMRVGADGTVPADFPVIVTSYEIVMADRKHLQRLRWRYLIVDEGHRLKNYDCKLLRELQYLSVENKLLLTGTPLQNDLGELWSLLHFLMPDIFSSLEKFQNWFDFSSMTQDGTDQDVVGREQRSKVVGKLHAILKPFVLRRVKADVEIALPRKQEIILYAHMTEDQQKLNQGLLEGTLSDDMSKLSQEGGGSASVGRLNNMLMQMRKICNHPDLLTAAYTKEMEYPSPEVLVAQCGKMQLLDRLLKRLHKEGHKVLIFSQMTAMLDVIESFLDQQGHQVARIDGSIPWQQRQAAISKFNEEPSHWVFLLSTRAGGLGINLTAADTVIIYDSDWNPQQDLQAMDRCHRIGQQKPVLVFRLATAGSVEGRMLRRAASKMALERLIIKKGAFRELNQESSVPQSMSAAELLEVLKPGVLTDDVPQSGVVNDAMLSKLLSRQHLGESKPMPYAKSGVGYEVVDHINDGGMLQAINS